MQRMNRRLKARNKQSVDIAIGVSSGPLIAGVIGLKSPRYRLVGDTVNIGALRSLLGSVLMYRCGQLR